MSTSLRRDSLLESSSIKPQKFDIFGRLFLMNVDKNLWANAFLQAGIDLDTLHNMGLSDFCTTCNALISSGVKPPLPKNAYGSSFDKKTRIAIQCALFQYRTEMFLRQKEEREKYRKYAKEFEIGPNKVDSVVVEQNKDYQKLIEDQERINQKKKDALIETIRKQREIEEARQEVIRKFKALPEEPAKGVFIAVNMPSGKRLKRKFDPEWKAEYLYSWVAGQEEMIQNERPTPFIIKNLTDAVDPGKSFTEQGIRRQIILNVIITEEEFSE